MKEKTCFDAKLLAYCALAGGGLLAAQPADAAIVYSGVKNLALTDNGTVSVDLDSDGAAEFIFVNRVRGASSETNFLELESNAVAYGGGTFKPAPGFQPAGPKMDSRSYFINLPLGSVVPGNLGWVTGQDSKEGKIRLSNLDTSSSSSTEAEGPFARTTPGYLGIRFVKQNLPHYGWIQYQGTPEDSSTLGGTVIDWAYETVPYKAILTGQKPCIDYDGDGYGNGEGCLGPDSNENNPDVYDNSTCAVVLTPGKISKVLSLFRPVAGFFIRGDENASFSGETIIDWGTGSIKPLLKLPIGKRTILALVRVESLMQNSGDVYHITVDNCIGSLTVTQW